MYLFDLKFNDEKKFFDELQKIYGLGYSDALLICKKLGFSKNLIVKNLTKTNIDKINKFFSIHKKKYSTSLHKMLDLLQKKENNILSYKNLRKKKKYPIRGQRTRTNASTARKLNKK